VIAGQFIWAGVVVTVHKVVHPHCGGKLTRGGNLTYADISFNYEDNFCLVTLCSVY